MSTSSFPGLGSTLGNGGAGARPISDEKMEQVRELLFGEFEKQTEARVVELEARGREMEQGLNRRLEALEARREALSGEIDANQRTAHQEIAGGLQELAERVRGISNG